MICTKYYFKVCPCYKMLILTVPQICSCFPLEIMVLQSILPLVCHLCPRIRLLVLINYLVNQYWFRFRMILRMCCLIHTLDQETWFRFFLKMKLSLWWILFLNSDCLALCICWCSRRAEKYFRWFWLDWPYGAVSREISEKANCLDSEGSILHPFALSYLVESIMLVV